MISVRQANFHIPARRQYGDCHRAVLASLFEMPLADVPHFCEDGPGPDRFDARVAAWLAERNLSSVTFPLTGSLQSVLAGISRSCPQSYWMLSGTSRGGVDHMVICRGAEIVHDPARGSMGLVGPCSNGYWWATFLTPIDPVSMRRQMGWPAAVREPWWRRALSSLGILP